MIKDNRPYAIIFDRDGTLAAVHNGPTSKAKDEWRMYNASLVFDAPIPEIVALLRAIRPGVVRIIVSGRMEGDHIGDRRRRFIMEDWLYKHEIPYDHLFMRVGGDYRLDSVVKREIMVQEILPYFKPIVAVDDRPAIWKVWEEFNLYVIKVENQPWRLPPIAFQIP